jgi:hypothetical protein
MLHHLKHALLTLAAIFFLIEAWLWDMTIALGRWLVGLLPWQEFKDFFARLVERLPPYGALPLFVIPVVVIEPLKIVAIRALAHGHFIKGVLAFIALKFIGVALIAFIFDLTRDKLLAIGWFERFYAWVVLWRDKAHAFIAPYKASVREKIAELKAQLSDLRRRLGLPEGRGGLVETLARLRARVQKTRKVEP